MLTSVAVEMGNTYAQTRIALLEFGERVVGLHGFIERPRRTPEFIVEFTQPIERNLRHEQV